MLLLGAIFTVNWYVTYIQGSLDNDLYYYFFVLKIIEFFDADPDPGRKNSDRGSGINISDPQH
jgi:hypothetical protein